MKCVGTQVVLDPDRGSSIFRTVSGSTARRPMPLKAQLKSSVASVSREQSKPDKTPPAKTLSIPEAGHLYFGLSKNGAYDAAQRGEIPFFQVGRLKRVSVAKMEQMMLDGVSITAPPPIETPIKTPAKTPAKPSKYPRSTAVKRRDRLPETVS
jgi:hypothetical protein